MLLIHQAGSVKIGEVVRYTLTYTPSSDRILPTPRHLHLRIKNTSAIPLRAAWVHGPYTLHVATYPSTFNPHVKVDDPERYGVPEFEPMLKAGGSWQAKLTVPEDIRETGADVGKRRHSMQSSHSAGESAVGKMTWIIEITSQILFSNSASVHFEVLVGRDDRSLDLGFAAVAAHGHGSPGQIKDQLSEKERRRARRSGNVQNSGVYSKAVRLVAEDTEALWDKPALPTWEEKDKADRKSGEKREGDASDNKPKKKKKRVHLVIVTHGLHSNLGADMLFLKESIDATVAQARVDAKERKKKYNSKSKKNVSAKEETVSGPPNPEDDNETSTAPLSGGQEELNNATEESDDEEETIVRGFSGNAVRTENGIQYLGKRLAKYILRFTYPDQPFLPVKKSLSRTLTDSLKSDARKAKRDGPPAHHGSSVHHLSEAEHEELPYTFSKISFVGHSLGGLIQTYAVAYIHKHSPTFFDHIEPINFICMASPMLGLSNENPMYVKFALDFGLVGRTGQDLGLTWRAPTLAKTGWNAVISGLSAQQKDQKSQEQDPSAKPLLRILPTGPAHHVLRMFCNRTVYSNVVNDGIVPLRTSCLLFLDWRGLGKVDKARRDNGLIGTVAEWGWNELTGANTNMNVPRRGAHEEDDDNQHVKDGEGDTVPLPAEDETADDNKLSTNRVSYDGDDESRPSDSGASTPPVTKKVANHHEKGMLDSLIDFFRPSTPEGRASPPTNKKTKKALRRGQTVHRDDDEADRARSRSGTTSNPTMRPHLPHLTTGQKGNKRPLASRGDSMVNPETGDLQAPPKTSIFESAGDILHPPLPSTEWLIDPTTRSRTIFHDRVYHPEDIPPPPVKRPGSRLTRSFSSDVSSSKLSHGSGDSSVSQDSIDSGGMKVEEKIARAYHRDLSWRKVLVRLEPDAHNNMIVRRMFANAYGWPVVKHLCDTHFADTYAAKTRDEDEPARERAPPMDKPVAATGEEVADQTAKEPQARTQSETREARDELADLSVSQEGLMAPHSAQGHLHPTLPSLNRQGSAVWDDAVFEGSNSDDSDVDERNIVNRFLNPMAIKKPEPAHHRREAEQKKDSSSTTTTPTQLSYTDGHRGLAPMSPPRTTTTAQSGTPVKPTFDSGSVESPVIASRLTEEPQALDDGAGSVANVGLRKTASGDGSPSKPARKKSTVADPMRVTHTQSQD